MMVESLRIHENAEVGALALSAAYGLLAGRLRRCPACDRPFVSKGPRWRQRVVCGRRTCVRRGRRTAAKLPPDLSPHFIAFRNRHLQWVNRRPKRLTKEQYQHLARRALGDLWKIDGLRGANRRRAIAEWESEPRWGYRVAHLPSILEQRARDPKQPHRATGETSEGGNTDDRATSA